MKHTRTAGITALYSVMCEGCRAHQTLSAQNRKQAETDAKTIGWHKTYLRGWLCVACFEKFKVNVNF